MRSDNILSSLGNRTSGLRRLWVEDSFSRLTNNGFAVGTGFTVEQRMGPGLNIRPSTLARCHISQRRGAAILSYEGSDNMARFQESGIRVKISCGLVQVLPSLRAFSVRQQATEVWTIAGNTLSTPDGAMILREGLERPNGRPATIEARLDSHNLVAATALIAWAKPGTVRLLTGSQPVSPLVPPPGQLDLFADAAPVLVTAKSFDSDADTAITQEVASQFLVACGWERSEDGSFRR